MTVTPFALGLVLVSGFLHAAWNLLAKRASGDASGPAFVWLYSALSTAIFAPLAAGAVVFGGERVGLLGLLFMFGTGVLHIGYFLSLQKGYQAGDLSVVYPLARGTGPLLASGAAILLLGERAGPVAVAGILLIVAGVFLLAREPDDGGRSPGEATWGCLWRVDRRLYRRLYPLGQVRRKRPLALADPLLLGVPAGTDRSPPAGRAAEAGEIRGAWRARRLETLGVAVLSPVAYLLVLTALVFAPVSRVAPAREIGILIGTLLGGGLLAEEGLGRRLLAAFCMVSGIVALAVG